MADLTELKQMVLSFRVSELHVLLGFAGRNKSGRKQELTQRALALVQKGCSLQVQIKVRELYRQIYPVGKAPSSSPIHQEDINMPLMQRHPGGLDYLNIRPVLPQAGKADVRLKRLPFYDVLAEILKPSSLVPKNNGRMQETLFVFSLTPQQAQDITMSRDFRPGAKCEYTVQVQLRFCLLEPSCEQADIFPSQIQVRVNNKPATLPNVIPTNKPNVEPKRPGRPVDITSLCRLSPTVSNAITVTWAADFTRSFCMSVYLVRKLSSEILLARLRQFGHRHLDHTRALITEKLAQDADNDIATTSLRVSLMCPLGKMRMQMPCRASTCTHLQCFDASTFLMMNERKPTWMCPVCDRPCPYDKLIIDGYFVDIFQQSPSCNDIVFHEDGSWSPIKQQKENANQVILTTTSKSLVSTAPSPLITSSSLTSASLSTSSSLPALSQPPTAAPVLKPAPTKGPVIDLTLDSSDEEEDDDDVISGEPVSCSPVINLDTPSPVSVTNVPASPTRDPASPTTGPALPTRGTALPTRDPALPTTHPALPTKGTALPTTGRALPAVGPSNSELPPSTITAISLPPSTVTTGSQPPSSLFQSNPCHHGAKSQQAPSHHRPKLQAPSHRDSPSSTADRTLRVSPSTTQTSSSSSSSNSLQSQTLNLEAMSDADFDEFLKGLSWGV